MAGKPLRPLQGGSRRTTLFREPRKPVSRTRTDDRQADWSSHEPRADAARREVVKLVPDVWPCGASGVTNSGTSDGRSISHRSPPNSAVGSWSSTERSKADTDSSNAIAEFCIYAFSSRWLLRSPSLLSHWFSVFGYYHNFCPDCSAIPATMVWYSYTNTHRNTQITEAYKRAYVRSRPRSRERSVQMSSKRPREAESAIMRSFLIHRGIWMDFWGLFIATCFFFVADYETWMFQRNGQIKT